MVPVGVVAGTNVVVWLFVRSRDSSLSLGATVGA